MRRPDWLSRNLLVLTVVSLLQDTASELIYPLLPLLLTVSFGAPAVVVGLVEGVAEGVAGVTRYLSGRWSDQIGRRPLIRAGYSLAAAGKMVIAAAGGWPAVLVGRSVDRLGKGIRSAPRDALLAADAAPDQVGRVFGFHRAGDTLGAVLGPLLGLAALALLDDDIGAVLWLAVIPAVLSALLVGRAREPAAPRALRVGSTRLRGSPLPKPFWQVTALMGLVSLVNLPDALLLLRLSDTGFTPTQVVAGYICFTASYAALSYPAGAVADRIGPPLVYALGLSCAAVGFIGLGLLGASVWAIPLLIVYGAFPALTDGVGKAWITRVTPEPHRGRAQGVFQMLTGFGVLIAGLWVGAAWSRGTGSGGSVLIVAGCLAAVAAAACAVLGPRLPGGDAVYAAR
jgi:MFS family permease